jgi:sugar-specific transcriptional regulator TrmB
MKSIELWLQSYGLNNTEITVYITILSHPEIKVTDIQRQTNLVRTTIYYTLAQLKSRGLVSENLQNNVKSYRATDISSLRHSIESDIADQQDKLEQLDSLNDVFAMLEKPALDTESYVARFEGTDAIKQSIDQALRCNSKRWHIIAARDNFLSYTSKKYQQYYLDERQRRGITAKTLWEPTDSKHVPSLQEIVYRNPRKLPEDFRSAFNSLVILYDDTTLIVDPPEQNTAHAIHNATSTNLLRMLHTTIWNNAERIK